MTSPKPVRLKVAYKSPQALVGQLTRSVGRGGVRVESQRGLAVGTKFVFELHTPGIEAPVEVFGEVTSANEATPGRWVLNIRYEPPRERLGLDSVIRRIFEAQASERKRRYPRIPLQVRAVEDKPEAPGYRLRDISRGGVGIDVESDTLPPYIVIGAPFLLQMRLSSGQLALSGEVAWTVSTRSDVLYPRVGIAFTELRPHVLQLLDELLALRAMAAPPWIARLEFGGEAITRRHDP